MKIMFSVLTCNLGGMMGLNKEKLNENIYNFFIKRTIFLFIFLVITAVCWLIWQQVKTGQINSFEECAAAGNPIMESYPEQCRANNQTFTKVY